MEGGMWGFPDLPSTTYRLLQRAVAWWSITVALGKREESSSLPFSFRFDCDAPRKSRAKNKRKPRNYARDNNVDACEDLLTGRPDFVKDKGI
jgi:hypothetical protein